MSIGDFPESLTQAILVGTMLVGRLGVSCDVIVVNRFFSSGGCVLMSASQKTVTGLLTTQS